MFLAGLKLMYEKLPSSLGEKKKLFDIQKYHGLIAPALMCVELLDNVFGMLFFRRILWELGGSGDSSCIAMDQ